MATTQKKTTRKKTAKKTTAKKPPRKAASAAKPGATKPAPKKPTKVSKPKRVSLLDAAATILKNSKQPMTAKAIVEAVTARGLWKSPGGKTPHASLYAAMIREISKKGKDARFEKIDRGLFKAA